MACVKYATCASFVIVHLNDSFPDKSAWVKARLEKLNQGLFSGDLISNYL